MQKTTLLLLTLTAIILDVVSGHGRLMEPPARNAMWRYGYPNPVNYNDNELYCGGFIVHYQKNGGKCGVCGDDYREKTPRSHEAGGLFGNGIIVRRYVVGQIIEITAELTTNHKGWMEVKICPHNNPKSLVTQKCLDDNPLEVIDSPHADGHQFVIPQESKKVETFSWKVQLPDQMTCSQCVMQWTYFAGNTWGSCIDGSEGVGCGDQETFINCADVEILSHTTVIPPNLVDNPWLVYFRENEFSPVEKIGAKPLSTAISSLPQLRPLIIRTQLCKPVGKYEEIPGMDDWCRMNCMKYVPNCHPEACKCVHECKAIGEFALKPDADIFCLQNCLKYPSYCPKERCTCF